jgi:hypothetical protein
MCRWQQQSMHSFPDHAAIARGKMASATRFLLYNVLF